MSDAATSVAELRLLDSFRQLSLNVRQSATDYLAAQEGLRLARQNLEVFDRMLKVNEAKVKAGELTGVELIRTRVAQQVRDITEFSYRRGEASLLEFLDAQRAAV